jgi:hypothetical protein
MEVAQQINPDKISYKISMVKYILNKGYSDFIFKVVGPVNMSFHIKDRYSSMRSFYSMLRKELEINYSF